MDDDSQRTCQNKLSKSLRKSHINRRRSNTSGKISSQLPHSSEIPSDQLSTDTDNDLLNVIIGDLTSDVDDTRATSASSILSTTNKNESISPPINENKHVLLTTKPPRTSKKRGKSNRYEERTHNSSKHLNNSDEKYDFTIRRKSIGDQRRDRLTKHMKDFYQDCFEFDQNSNINYLPDNILNIDKRKEYSTALW